MAAFVLAFFLPLELLSGMPALHRHASEPGFGVPLRTGTALEAEAESAPAPFDCPACTVSGLSAVAPLGVDDVAPAVVEISFVVHLSSADSSPNLPASRGRAPPPA